MATTIQNSRIARCGAALCMALPIPTGAFAFQDEGTVKIGFIESKTGQYASTGIPGLAGSQIALDEINAAGGIVVDGLKVKIAASDNGQGYDGGSEPGAALTAVKRAAFEDKVLMIKGLSNSNSGQAVYSYLRDLEQQGTPLVVESSTVGAPGLTTISKWGFRNIFAESEVVPRVAAKAQSQTAAKSVAFFLQKDNIYFPAMTDIIQRAMTQLGVKTVAVAETLSSDRDVTRQVDQLRNADPDLVYVMCDQFPSVAFMKEAHRRGLKPKLFVGGISQLNTEVVKQGELFNGMVLAGAYDPASPALAKFAAEYTRRTGLDINQYAVNAYEAIYLIKDGIEHSDIKNTPESLQDDREKFRQALATKASITSVTGEKLSFNEDRETPKAGIFLTYRDGKLAVWK